MDEIMVELQAAPLIPGTRHVARAAEPRHNSLISGLGAPSPDHKVFIREAAPASVIRHVR